MSFDKLLADLGALATADADLTKAIGAEGDDAAIAAAAADGADAGADADAEAGDKPGAEAAAAEAAAEGGDVMKSMTITNEAGEEEDVIDATEFLKSLGARVDANETGSMKAIGQLVDLVKSQAGHIATLNSKVAALAGAGRGRRAVVSVADRPDMTKSMAGKDEPDGMKPDEFMAKAMTAMREGKVTGGEIAACESRLNRNLQPDAAIVSKVLG